MTRRDLSATLTVALMGGLALLIATAPALDAPAAASASYQQDPGPDGLVRIEAEDISSSRPGSGLAWRVSTDPPGDPGGGRVVLAPRDSARAEESPDLPITWTR